MNDHDQDFDRSAIAVLRGFAMDGPAKAKSGHQGTAMALSPLAHVLFSRVLRYDPTEPSWFDRDRFILSAGHASILLYGALHLAGYPITVDDLEQFRQLHSLTPGHPEVGHTPGVEVTTGPLGQGFANAVGMALAERTLRARFGPELCDHFTYVIAGDGCLEEGVSHEAASLAGRQGLGRLIAIYDDNRITIDGPTSMALIDDPAARFAAYGWHVLDLGDAGEDLDTIEEALRAAALVEDRPSILILRTHIAFPSPSLVDTKEAHGLAFGPEAIAETKALLGLPIDESFTTLPAAIEGYAAQRPGRIDAREAWEQRVAAHPNRALFEAALAGVDSAAIDAALPRFTPGESIATRNAIKTCLKATAGAIPGIITGSADLTENTGVSLDPADALSAENPGGVQLHYGVREHAMAAAMNGMALHGGIVPLGGTFFVFSDYLRPALRLAALSKAHVVYSFTHDSIGVGEDGPTHQPIEHLSSLRAMPGLELFRPADATETAYAWAEALQVDGPVALVLSRQNLPVLEGTSRDGVARGGYVISPADGARATLVATGSEVSLCLEAQRLLATEGIATQVVSMPSVGRFTRQDLAYRTSVIAPGVLSVSVEAGSTFGWGSLCDLQVGIDRFGLSAPAPAVFETLGITAHVVVDLVRQHLTEQGAR